MDKLKRLDYVDIAKGLGMLMVIWGHINSGSTFVLVYSFHMPLFFFLSGLVFNSNRYQSFKDFFIRRVKTLVIPYLIFSFLTWLVWVAYTVIFHSPVDSYFMPLLQTFIAQGSGGFLVHNVPLWFVSCLLLIEVLYYFISKVKNDLIIILICVLFAITSYVMELCLPIFDFTLLPWSIGVAFAAIIFYAAGNLLMKRNFISRVKEFCNNKKAISWVILVFMTVALYYFALLNGHITMGHEQYNNRFLFYFNGFLGSFCVLIFTFLMEKLFSIKVFSIIKWIGLNSLYFMLIENPIKGFVVAILRRVLCFSDSAISYSLGWSLVAFIISTVITIITVELILIIRNSIKKDGRLIKC